jgi:hypothetical protein
VWHTSALEEATRREDKVLEAKIPGGQHFERLRHKEGEEGGHDREVGDALVLSVHQGGGHIPRRDGHVPRQHPVHPHGCDVPCPCLSRTLPVVHSARPQVAATLKQGSRGQISDGTAGQRGSRGESGCASWRGRAAPGKRMKGTRAQPALLGKQSKPAEERDGAALCSGRHSLPPGK